MDAFDEIAILKKEIEQLKARILVLETLKPQPITIPMPYPVHYPPMQPYIPEPRPWWQGGGITFTCNKDTANGGYTIGLPGDPVVIGDRQPKAILDLKDHWKGPGQVM